MYDIPYLDLPPLRLASGRVRLPGSKSISNRVLLLAGLAQGTTAIHDLLDSDDTRVMLDALRVLGCTLKRQGVVLNVTGIGGQLPVHEASFFLGNAGTAMRPLTAALALLAATQGGRFEVSGVARMHERPIGDTSMPCARWAAPSTTLARPATRRCACRAKPVGGSRWAHRSRCAATFPASSSPRSCWRCPWSLTSKMW